MATGLGKFADALGFALLNDILSSFRGGNAYGRPNLYEVQIHPPRGASPAMGGHDTRDISLRVESLQMPGRSLETQIASAGAITGPQREYVTQPLFADNVTTFDVGYYDEYAGTMDIYLLDRNNKKTFGLKIEECYPKSIAALELAAGPSTEIIKTTVAWTFRKFSPLDAESQQSLGGTLIDTLTDTVERTLTRNASAVARKLL